MTTETKKQKNFNFRAPLRSTYTKLMLPSTFVKGKPEVVGCGPSAKYSSTFIVDLASETTDGKKAKEYFDALKKAVTTLLNEHNPSGKKLKIGRLTEEQEAAKSHIEVNVPWRDGTKDADKAKEKGQDREIFRGKILLKATSKFPPVLCVRENGVVVEHPATEEPQEGGWVKYTQPAVLAKYFYSGAWMFPSFGLHWYKGDEGKPSGVSLYLNMVLFYKHDARFGGRSQNATEVFKECVGEFTSEDPTGGVENFDEEEAL